MSATQQGFSRRQVWITVLTTLGVVLAAAAPGMWSFLGDGARVKAVQAALEQAERADAKTELTYELLKQRVEFMDRQVLELRADVREVQALLLRLQVERAVSVRGAGRQSAARGGGAAEGAVDAMTADMDAHPPEIAKEQQAEVLPTPTALERLVDRRIKAKEERR